MCRYETGMPRSPKSQVNWCVASGECESACLARLDASGVEAPLARVVGELERAPIFASRFGAATESTKEVRPRRRQQVIAAKRGRIDAVEGDEPGRGPAGES